MKTASFVLLQPGKTPNSSSFITKNEQSRFFRPVIQAKLTINESGDAYEQEADAVADKVMHMPTPPSVSDGKMQMKPMLFSQIQRKCADCEEKEKVQRKENGSGGGQAAPTIVRDVLASSGQLLDGSARQFMESRMGHDFSKVQIHTDGKAAESAAAVHALAYTSGNHVVFNRGQYAPDTEGGKRLLAHELTHVVQQNKGTHNQISLKRFKDTTAFASPRFRIWNITVDVKNAPADEDDMYDFIWVYHEGISKAIEVLEGYGISPKAVKITMTFKTHFNEEKVEQEAYDKVYSQFEAAIAKKYPPKPKPKEEVVKDEPKEVVKEKVCPPTSVIQASTLSEYIDLVLCAEKLTGLSNRDLLSLLRQLYYGSSSWSSSKNSAWDAVIPCKISFAKSPMETYDSNLFQSLQNSQVVDGKDIGHIFTGLEAMACPQEVVISKQKFGVGITLPTDISNELFATWVGDIGSAVGRYVACWDMVGEADDATRQKVCDISGANFRDLTYYFAKLASVADLEGDIAAFVIRAEQNGIACQGSLTNKFVINASVSQILNTHFFDDKAKQSDKNRYLCFAQSIGATISGNKITNKGALNDKYSQQISNFAQLTYANDVVKKGSRIPQCPTLEAISSNSSKALTIFWNWVERQL
jgi:hypothetical protein